MPAPALYVVATPIGNLADITQRALDTLSQVDVIACEDTRRSRVLASHYGIPTPMIAYHDHSEARVTEQLLERLHKGQAIALISDAGTPLIADPGYKLVNNVREAGFPVIPVPGVSALTAALSAAGMPTDRFVFEGFLPAKREARCKKLQELHDEPRTIVVYESSHRIVSACEDLLAVFGEQRCIVLARELTKQFETFLSGTAPELLARLSEDPNQCRGEFVLIIEGAAAPEQGAAQQQADAMLAVLLEEVSVKQAAKLASKLLGQKKNFLYDRALALSQAAK